MIRSADDAPYGAPDGGPARRLLALILVAGLALAGGAGFWRLFPPGELAVRLSVAAVLPVTLIGVLCWRGRAPALLVSVPVWTIAFAVWTAQTVAASAGDVGARLSLVRTGVADGWARLLDVAVPAPSDPDLLIVPLLLTWTAAALGAELAVRTRTRLLPALPGVLALLAATVLSVPAAGSNAGIAVATAALAAFLVLVRRPAAQAPARGRRMRAFIGGAGSTGVLVIAAAAAAAFVSPVLGADDPVDPRAYRSTPAEPAAGLHPLSALAGWTAHPDEILLRVGSVGASVGASSDASSDAEMALRLAVFDDYDGVSWRSTGKFIRVGDSIPSSDESTPAAAATRRAESESESESEIEIEIEGLRGSFLPAAGRPVRLDLPVEAEVGVLVDPVAGILLGGQPLTTGFRYRVDSAPGPSPAPSDLATLSVDGYRGGGDSPVLAIPQPPLPVVRELASVAAGRGGSPFQRAAMLRQYLSTSFVFDPAVPPGHSLAHIEHFLSHTRRGTSEQFATAFVLAARVLDLPARLVVGFTAPAASPSPAGEARIVHGGDALAWAEVYFDEVGWVPFFPTPRAADARGAGVVGANQGESAEQAELVAAALRAPSEVVAPPEPAARPAVPGGRLASPGSWLGPVLTATAGAGALFAAYLGVAVFLPAMRRYRARHASDWRDRVVGAWQRTIEVLGEIGIVVPPAATPTEVAALAAARAAPGAAPTGAAPSPVSGLADLVCLVLFAPDPSTGGRDISVRPGGRNGSDFTADPDFPVDSPGAGGAPGRRTADEAWRLADRFARDARRTVPRTRRIRRRLAPSTVHAIVRRRVR